MSAYPAYVMGGLCIVGGLTGFARTRSVPSLVAGVGVGLLYLYSADSIRKGTANGLETALAASALLFVSSAPRAMKGPVPAMLTATSAITGSYYGRTVYNSFGLTKGMHPNRIAENVLGTTGTICWTGQVIPQIWKSWREKDVEGLSHWLMFLWAVAAAFLGVFNITQNFNIPLIVQPQLFSFLSLLSWSQCMFYGFKHPLRQTVIVFLGFATILGGFEAGMVFAIRPTVRHGNQAPATFFGIATSVLLSAGLFPQYYEIWRYGEVKGISLVFMTIDLLGGVFSVLSLVFKEKFDILGGIAYGAVVVLDGVVIVLALVLNPRAERRRRAALENRSGLVLEIVNGESRRLVKNADNETNGKGGETAPVGGGAPEEHARTDVSLANGNSSESSRSVHSSLPGRTAITDSLAKS